MGFLSRLFGGRKQDHEPETTPSQPAKPAASKTNTTTRSNSTQAAASSSRTQLSNVQRYQLENTYHGSMLTMGVVENIPRLVEMGLANGEKPNRRYSYEEFSDSITSPNQERIITPIVQAAVNDNLEITKLLIEHGADPNYTQQNGESALADAANRGSVELTKYLLDNGANPNLKKPFGTPLAFADGVAVMRVLLEHGADPNIPDSDGDLPIIGSIDSNRMGEIALLIEYGTDMSHKNRRGETPLDHARRWGINEKVHELIKQYGSQTEAPQQASVNTPEPPGKFWMEEEGEKSSYDDEYWDGGAPEDESWPVEAKDVEPSLVWTAEVSSHTDSLYVTATVPGANTKAVLAPGEDVAPRMMIPYPDGKGGLCWVYLWNTPSTVVDSPLGPIHVQGLKHTLRQADKDFSEILERDFVFEFNEYAVISLKNVFVSLKDNPLASLNLARMNGLDLAAKRTSVSPIWNVAYDQNGKVKGYESIIPGGFNKLFWYPDQMQCPALTCITPDGISTSICYVWDLSAEAFDASGSGRRAIVGVKQLCSKQCPNILEWLQDVVYSFRGLAVIPGDIADVAFTEATGKPIWKRPRRNI